MSDFNNNNFLNTIPVVTRNILIINFIIWVVLYLTGGMHSIFIKHLALYPFKAGFFPTQLLTHMFTHIEFSHIFFNMFALFMFGRILESYWGPKRYLIYYLITGIGAGLIQLLVFYFQEMVYPIASFGASGAVFGLLLAFGMLFPNTSIYIMFIPIPVKAKYMVIGYGLLEFFFGIANRAGDNVAHFAHLGGMLFGILLILYWRKKGVGNGRYYH